MKACDVGNVALSILGDTSKYEEVPFAQDPHSNIMNFYTSTSKAIAKLLGEHKLAGNAWWNIRL